MALIDDLTQRIAAELHRTLDEAIRQAVESYIVGDRHLPARSVSHRKAAPARRSSKPVNRENRNRTIIDAVAKLGEASVEDVARFTGWDKRGVGSSLHYLAAAGKLRHAGAGRYKATRGAHAA